MKIGILTASRTDNNGTDLQAYAMQTLFQRDGNDVELINYQCEKLENSRKVFYPHTLRGLLSIPYNLYKHYGYHGFISCGQKHQDEINRQTHQGKLLRD